MTTGIPCFDRKSTSMTNTDKALVMRREGIKQERGSLTFPTLSGPTRTILSSLALLPQNILVIIREEEVSIWSG